MANRRRFTPAEEEAIIDEHVEGGRALSELARLHGCGRATVLAIFERRGIHARRVRRRPQTFAPEEIARILERWAQGESITATARAERAARPTIKRLLVSRGVKPEERLRTPSPRARRFTADDEARIVKEHLEHGLTLAELCRRYRCGFKTLIRVFGRNGVEPRRRRGALARRFSPRETARILHAWDSGSHVSVLAREHRAGTATIERVLLAHHRKPTRRTRAGARHPNWRGGRQVRNGYVYVWIARDDPLASMAVRSGYVAEHRLVMARALGRPLSRFETVHHVNGIRDDNRLGNLQLRRGRHGSGIALRCADCGSVNVVADALGTASGRAA